MPQMFVVQEHTADRAGHHYDFRLQDGLKAESWVLRYIPVNKKKRLAIKVADHDGDWMGFEGTIPKGEYGAGTVDIWDQGEYDVLVRQPGLLKVYLSGGQMVGEYWLKYWEDNKWLMWKDLE